MWCDYSDPKSNETKNSQVGIRIFDFLLIYYNHLNIIQRD